MNNKGRFVGYISSGTSVLFEFMYLEKKKGGGIIIYTTVKGERMDGRRS
jgi:hypothetical protein